MNREQIIETYLINSPKVVAEMLHDTIEKYEAELKEKNEACDSIIKTVREGYERVENELKNRTCGNCTVMNCKILNAIANTGKIRLVNFGCTEWEKK